MNSTDTKNIKSSLELAIQIQAQVNQLNQLLLSYKGLDKEISKLDVEKNGEVEFIVHYDKSGWITGAEFWCPSVEDYIYTNRADLEHRFSGHLEKFQNLVDQYIIDRLANSRRKNQLID